MARKKTKVNESTIVGIDAGTTKVTAVVARVYRDYQEILGVATVPLNASYSESPEMVRSELKCTIMRAFEEACKSTGCHPQTAFIGISGFVESCNVSVCTEIEHRVTRYDIQGLIDAAAGRDIPEHLVMLEQVVKPFYINRNEECESACNNDPLLA